MVVRTLSELPLPPSVQSKLAGAGFATVGDLDGLQPAELAAEAAEQDWDSVENMLKMQAS